MSSIWGDLRTAADVPKSNRAIAARRQCLAIVEKDDAGDRVSVSLDSADLLAGGRFPYADRLQLPGSQHFASGRKGERIGPVAVALQRTNLLARGHIPQADGRIVGSRGEYPSIGRKDHGLYEADVVVRFGFLFRQGGLYGETPCLFSRF